MPAPPPRPGIARPRLAVVYWAAAVVVYGVLGAFFPPFFLLGFWESVPALLIITIVAARLFPRPVPPLPSRERR